MDSKAYTRWCSVKYLLQKKQNTCLQNSQGNIGSRAFFYSKIVRLHSVLFFNKKYSTTGNLLWFLRHFSEHYITPPNGYSWVTCGFVKITQSKDFRKASTLAQQKINHQHNMKRNSSKRNLLHFYICRLRNAKNVEGAICRCSLR